MEAAKSGVAVATISSASEVNPAARNGRSNAAAWGPRIASTIPGNAWSRYLLDCASIERNAAKISRIVASPTERPVVMRQMLPTASVLKSTVVIWKSWAYIPLVNCASESESSDISVRRIIPSGSKVVKSP